MFFKWRQHLNFVILLSSNMEKGEAFIWTNLNPIHQCYFVPSLLSNGQVVLKMFKWIFNVVNVILFMMIRKGHSSPQLGRAKKSEKQELIETPHVKVYKNLPSFTEINPCDQASTVCPSSQCVSIPQKPYYFCKGCPSGKTGNLCTIGMLLTIKRTRRLFCDEIIERTFSSLPCVTI